MLWNVSVSVVDVFLISMTMSKMAPEWIGGFEESSVSWRSPRAREGPTSSVSAHTENSDRMSCRIGVFMARVPGDRPLSRKRGRGCSVENLRTLPHIITYYDM